VFIVAILMQDKVIIGRYLIKDSKMCQNSQILGKTVTYLKNIYGGGCNGLGIGRRGRDEKCIENFSRKT
jgi:hypothetical protein